MLYSSLFIKANYTIFLRMNKTLKNHSYSLPSGVYQRQRCEQRCRSNVVQRRPARPLSGFSAPAVHLVHGRTRSPNSLLIYIIEVLVRLHALAAGVLWTRLWAADTLNTFQRSIQVAPEGRQWWITHKWCGSGNNNLVKIINSFKWT